MEWTCGPELARTIEQQMWAAVEPHDTPEVLQRYFDPEGEYSGA
jgi:hypothetical protein